MADDAVLLVAFGGPSAPRTSARSSREVLRGGPVPPERVEEVVHHYEVIGGARR
jgi:ferrochelatase